MNYRKWVTNELDKRWRIANRASTELEPGMGEVLREHISGYIRIFDNEKYKEFESKVKLENLARKALFGWWRGHVE
jgi:hypothetical protein